MCAEKGDLAGKNTGWNTVRDAGCVMPRLCAILLMLITCGCVVTAPMAMGTGGAVADIVPVEVIWFGVAEIGLHAVGGLPRFGGNPKWALFIPGWRWEVERINGVTFAGEGW